MKYGELEEAISQWWEEEYAGTQETDGVGFTLLYRSRREGPEEEVVLTSPVTVLVRWDDDGDPFDVIMNGVGGIVEKACPPVRKLGYWTQESWIMANWDEQVAVLFFMPLALTFAPTGRE